MNNQTSKESSGYPLGCACGRVKGTLDTRGWQLHARCYCRSCQSFAEQLGASDRVIDDRGGTDVLITAPRYVRIDQGQEELACLQLSSGGPIRWYAKCCNTPIGNTPATPGKAIISMVHASLGGREKLEANFGPAEAIVHTNQALGEPKPEKVTSRSLKLTIAARLIGARLSGAWRKTPFFDARGKPIVTPHPPASE